MIESPTIGNNVTVSQISKVVSKVGDIVKNHHYSNNLDKKGPSLLQPEIVGDKTISEEFYNVLEPESIPSICHNVAEQIENCLKEAKSKTLECCEVLIPCNLTLQIAKDIVGMSSPEPCGLRGCYLYINFEDKDHCRRIGQLKFGDRTTVPTFEMYLYLKRNSYSWLSVIASKIMRNFGRSSLVISDGYKLSKKKLFRSINI